MFDPESPNNERRAHSYKLSSIHHISATVYAHVYTQTHTQINKCKMKEQEEKKKKKEFKSNYWASCGRAHL